MRFAVDCFTMCLTMLERLSSSVVALLSCVGYLLICAILVVEELCISFVPLYFMSKQSRSFSG